MSDKAYYTITYPNGSTVEDYILVRMLQHPAYVLELIWGYSIYMNQVRLNC